MTTAHITDTLPEHWKYISEGGATIVFAYQGPPKPEFDGTVLRLRKTPILITPDFKSYTEGQNEEEPDDPMIEFQTKCMERLIPREHLPRLESVRVSRAWLESLVVLHDAKRPEDRRQKDQVDLARTKGVLATDLVGGTQLAVEIKPKWAFLPSSVHLSETTRPIKSRTCRFCMHSSLKAMNGETVSLGYCPLDLFSGDKDRITKAIHSLWDAWSASNGKVNNMKIFMQGMKIYPSNASSILLNPAEYTGDLRDAFTAALLPALMGTPVLRTLSKLQRTLDCLDVEGLSDLWRRTEMSTDTDKSLVPPTSPIGVSSSSLSSPEPTILDWTNFLDTYLSSTSAQLDHSSPEPKNLRYYLLAYLLSATFKDCSIIIRLDPLQPSVSVPAQVKPDRVTVIDLDPKSMDRVQKWEKLDREIVHAYLNVDERKICVDGWVE